VWRINIDKKHSIPTQWFLTHLSLCSLILITKLSERKYKIH